MPRRGCDLICIDMEYLVICFIRLITMEGLIGFFPKFFASEVRPSVTLFPENVVFL